MNNTYQAKNGFKTFILSLTISVVAFSFVYYYSTDLKTNLDIESASISTPSSSTKELASNSNNVTSEKNDKTNETKVLGATTTKTNEQKSLFKPITQNTPQVEKKVVLAGADTATTSNGTTSTGTTSTGTTTTVTTTSQTSAAVPNAGSTEITIGLLLSLMAFAYFTYLVSNNPRKTALARFEEKMRN